MKTSLSKTFLDLSRDKNSCDLIHPDRETKREISDENNAALKPEQVFVIEPYNENFDSEKTSLLLVNQAIKKQYDDALKKIEAKKDELFKRLKQRSGLTGRTVTPETELLKQFGYTSIYDLLDVSEKDVGEKPDERLAVIVYERLFNEKALALLESGQISQQLKDYIEKYNELIVGSPILSKTFNHYHAKTVNKNLADNGFFAANHSVNLFNGQTKEEITSADDLNAKIEGEKTRILTDDGLNKKFEAIDKKLTTKELREFRDYLLDNRDVVAELGDYKKLQKDIWLSYLSAERSTYLDFLKEYQSGKEIIKQSIEAAKQEETEWKEVIRIFNERFAVPFTLEVSNQEDVILKGTRPEIAFGFKEDGQSKPVDRKLLLEVLSQGEKRALYILNILFEISARQKQGQETLVIADDIADSFDYKNKYAIVEYLKDVSELNKFYCIFLTHNFDFHRTISGRLGIKRSNRLFAVKNGRNLSLKEEKYQNNPFEFWKDNLEDRRYAISSIPFVRNLAEYCGRDAEFNRLTSLLHMKVDTAAITVQDLENLYKSIINKPNLTLADSQKPVIDVIHELADEIAQENDEQAELESKIILSIAIRLMAEAFMVRKIANQPFVDGITKNQTMQLLKKYRHDFPQERDPIALMEQVNLMTPENIHLNSFMYEPILDMLPKHLKQLYAAVKIVH
ncbi:MAG TPA: hypothetical protein PL023_07315 [Thiobacillus sp.]|nr:hypothetical protein [Thiobacillus sp.]